ncbi:c-type cyclin [Sporothrix brasiliensis 5110]|uniref:RNA polymerase II holoenzyme cyclin-like subunit n=1 Tax=Sporothrix brasiliensis 5110 TaxID=1398154 RepID=A0A0C2F5N2_9PEZI|nr:c-type cyclin [Sporothrix brasiliensis 5110]KIH86348.1 c-type cyclin [Sporothrix brasiliensis 5110]
MGRRGPRHGGGGGGGGFRQGGGNNYSNNQNNGGGSGKSTHNAHNAHNAHNGHPPPPSQPQVITEEHPPVKGPNPGYIAVGSQYMLEQQLRTLQRETGCDPAREDSYRLQGVQLIDNVRQALQLPVKTFATACTYYHKFRLNFRDAEYNFQDAALSALFVACKVEDTIKKSKEVLCAAYNLKNPDKPTTPDDKIFERPSAIIVGLDRLILQTVGFDFRVRYPQKLLIKLLRQLIPAEDARAFLGVAYPMSIDLYKTFAPIKQTSFTMALASIELTARILDDKHLDRVRQLTIAKSSMAGGGGDGYYHTSRSCVVETLLDLLDLYTQFTKSTKVGSQFDLNRFIDIKIKINQEVDDDPDLHRTDAWYEQCGGDNHGGSNTIQTPGSIRSPATTGSGPHAGGAGGTAGGGSSGVFGASVKPRKHVGTMRFLFEVGRMRQEEAAVNEYFKEEYTEVETEVDELIPESSRGGGGGGGNHHHNGNNNNNNNRSHAPSRRERNNHNHHNNQNHQKQGGGGGSGDANWGPYQRSRNNDHRHHKARKGGGYC